MQQQLCRGILRTSCTRTCCILLQSLVDAKPEQVVEVVTTNLLGSLLATRAAIQVMGDQPTAGHIFNVDGAGADGAPSPQYAAYGATKAGACAGPSSPCHTCLAAAIGLVSSRVWPLLFMYAAASSFCAPLLTHWTLPFWILLLIFTCTPARRHRTHDGQPERGAAGGGQQRVGPHHLPRHGADWCAFAVHAWCIAQVAHFLQL